jgi:hypothetical protein
MRDPAFRARVNALRNEMISEVVGRLVYAATAAVRTLEALLTARSDTATLGAAKAILELGVRLRESTEMAQRIEELERVTREQRQNEPSKQT